MNAKRGFHLKLMPLGAPWTGNPAYQKCWARLRIPSPCFSCCYVYLLPRTQA